MAPKTAGQIHIGIGGWVFEPWRGTFYPENLSQKRELEYAASKLTSIEINGTYYGSQKPESFAKWRAETPDGFVFALKGSRFCTNRRVLAEAGPSVEKFVSSGLSELKEKLGPINWQFMATKKFDEADFASFLNLLPATLNGVKLRHALEVRSPTFATPAFIKMAKDHNAAIVTAKDEDFPEIDERTADFSYARFMATHADAKDGVSPKILKSLADETKAWAKGGDVFAYFISGEKVKNPAAAQALIKLLAKG